MTKEKAIMELMCNAKQVEALENCIKILEGWETRARQSVRTLR